MTHAEFERLARAKGFVPTSDGAITHESRTVRRPADSQRDNSGPHAELERHPSDGTLGKRQIQNLAPSGVLIRLTSYRTRLLDEDNLCEKYLVDCCRYAGLIRQDDPRAAKIEVRQEKVGHGEPEFVRIEIFHPKTTVLI